MRILALDSSGLVASAAIVEEDVAIAEYTIDYKRHIHMTLLPMIDELKRMTEMDLKTIDAIAVAAGPGFFYRIVVLALRQAKGLGFCA